MEREREREEKRESEIFFIQSAFTPRISSRASTMLFFSMQTNKKRINARTPFLSLDDRHLMAWLLYSKINITPDCVYVRKRPMIDRVRIIDLKYGERERMKVVVAQHIRGLRSGILIR